MPHLIVVNDPKDWPLKLSDARIVAAKSYLTGEEFAALRTARVFNLCRSYRYQSTGYYVSLLAAARGHKPLPDITTIQDLKSQTIVKLAAENLDAHIQSSLGKLRSRDFVLSIYFGHNLAKRYETLSQELFKLFRAPFLRATFVYHEKGGKWLLQNIRPIAASEIPEDHHAFVIDKANQYFKSRQSRRPKAGCRFDLAILHDPDEKEPPSNRRALQKFVRAAEQVGLCAELITKNDYGRLAEFDGLFIRETTSVNHHTYRFARRAAAKRLVVVDDPESILKCTNKVFLAELLSRNRIPIPRTIIVHKDNAAGLEGRLGLPCILKQPDSSFSQGVYKVETRDELREQLQKLLERSDLVIAQEFLPTSFDWRVGVFNRRPLYACKYFMADKHWQIIKRDERGRKTCDGMSETVPVESAPPEVIATAVKAADLIGDGLYGVDIKESRGRLYLIEINDNPNIDAGIEDAVLKDGLYREVMGVFMDRIEMRKGGEAMTAQPAGSRRQNGLGNQR
ncbi:MAG: RimK family protein [Thermodesulfobacteriota bacterium]